MDRRVVSYCEHVTYLVVFVISEANSTLYARASCGDALNRRDVLNVLTSCSQLKTS